MFTCYNSRWKEMGKKSFQRYTEQKGSYSLNGYKSKRGEEERGMLLR